MVPRWYFVIVGHASVRVTGFLHQFFLILIVFKNLVDRVE